MSVLKYAHEIVRSYVSRNEISPEEVSELLINVHKTLLSLSDSSESSETLLHQETMETEGAVDEEVVDVDKKDPGPVVPISEAVTEDAVFCLICGKANKAIRGHLSRTHGMDVKEYREKFNLPNDFLMVAPSYSARRRKLAIDAGLGEKLQAGRKRRRKK